MFLFRTSSNMRWCKLSWWIQFCNLSSRTRGAQTSDLQPKENVSFEYLILFSGILLLMKKSFLRISLFWFIPIWSSTEEKVICWAKIKTNNNVNFKTTNGILKEIWFWIWLISWRMLWVIYMIQIYACSKKKRERCNVW